MTLSDELRKYVIGKKIIKVLLNQFSNDTHYGNPYSYDPEIFLDDGTIIKFVVDETEVGEYGITPIVVRGD